MAKFRTQPFLGLVVGAFFGLVAGACSYGAINQDALVVVCFVLGGALAGVALGLKFNPTVSMYWPWLVVTFGIGCIVANNIVIGQRLQMQDLNPIGYYPYLICALIATVTALFAGIAHHAKSIQKGEKDDVSNFSLATILLVLGGASVAFGLLRWIDAPDVFFYIVVIFILGRFACLVVNAFLSKRQVSLSPPAASPENGQFEIIPPENPLD